MPAWWPSILSTGELAPAIGELEALRTLSPRDEGVLFLLGFAYRKSHEPDRAKAVFQQMFEAVGPARAQFLAGRSYYEAALFEGCPTKHPRFSHAIPLRYIRPRRHSMSWAALLKPRTTATCGRLRICFEDTDQPGWLVRLYDGHDCIGEAVAEDPHHALDQILATAREHLHEPDLTSADLVWVRT